MREVDTQKVVKLYFRCKPNPKKKDAQVVDVDVTGDGMAFCKRFCEEYKDNNGYGNLYNHIATNHDDYKDVLAEQKRSEAPGGPMNRFVVEKAVSSDAKSMHGWIEWIVLAALPVTIVQNECYIKCSRNKSVRLSK